MLRNKVLCRLTGAVLGATGLVLTIGGFWFATSGDLYYVLAGLAMLAASFFTLRFDPRALWIYAGLIAGTLIWALTEAGLNNWVLSPRADIILPLGILIGLPFVFGGLTLYAPGPFGRRGGVVALWTAIGLSGLLVASTITFPSNTMAEAVPQSPDIPLVTEIA